MSDQPDATSETEDAKDTASGMALDIAIGMSLGTVIGLALDTIVIGIAGAIAMGTARGLHALSDRRPLFVDSAGSNGATLAAAAFPLAQLTIVATQHGSRGSTLIVEVGGKPARLRNVAPVERTSEFAHYIRRRSGTGDGPAPADVILPPQADVIALLKQLGDLRDAGVLTDDEFNTKKRELLARI